MESFSSILGIAVIPAQAGIQDRRGFWNPAFAEMTTRYFIHQVGDKSPGIFELQILPRIKMIQIASIWLHVILF